MSAATVQNGNGVDKRVSALEQGYAVMQADVTGIKAGQVEQNAKLDSVLSRMSNQGKPNWAVIFGACGIFVPIITALWIVIKLQTDATIAPLVAKSSSSETDRAYLNQKTDTNGSRIAELNAKQAAHEAALTEIESQFRALENYQNLMRADQIRTNALLWKKAFGDEYPSGAAFYPSIARPK